MQRVREQVSGSTLPSASRARQQPLINLNGLLPEARSVHCLERTEYARNLPSTETALGRTNPQAHFNGSRQLVSKAYGRAALKSCFPALVLQAQSKRV